jgi:hypothetical protein
MTYGKAEAGNSKTAKNSMDHIMVLSNGMSSIALGVMVAFLKKPALPALHCLLNHPKQTNKQKKSIIKIVGVQSRNKCSLWNVERKE